MELAGQIRNAVMGFRATINDDTSAADAVDNVLAIIDDCINDAYHNEVAQHLDELNAGKSVLLHTVTKTQRGIVQLNSKEG